jgi:SAM-dependent methyltransferase
MSDQISYYNNFGIKYKDAIVNSHDPSVWTSDMKEGGVIFLKMKNRISEQERFILTHFSTAKRVLDLGCGFGRQVYLMARNGYDVVGVDNSQIFIDIAESILKKKQLKGKLICDSAQYFQTGEKFDQITFFDVLEHIKPTERIQFLNHVKEKLCSKKAKLIISFPYVNTNSIKDSIVNIIKSLTYRIPALASGKEHPYPIPSRPQFEKLYDKLFTLLEHKVIDDTAFYVLEVK